MEAWQGMGEEKRAHLMNPLGISTHRCRHRQRQRRTQTPAAGAIDEAPRSVDCLGQHHERSDFERKHRRRRARASQHLSPQRVSLLRISAPPAPCTCVAAPRGPCRARHPAPLSLCICNMYVLYAYATCAAPRGPCRARHPAPQTPARRPLGVQAPER